MDNALTAAELTAFAAILVAAIATTGNAAFWLARATESYPVGTDAEAFAPFVLDAAASAGRLLTPGPSAVCWETFPDGSAPVRLSFAIKVF